MRQKTGKTKEPADPVVNDVRRATRGQFSAEEKIGIVFYGLRREESIDEQTYGRIEPLVTVHSGSDLIDPLRAPEMVLRALPAVVTWD